MRGQFSRMKRTSCPSASNRWTLFDLSFIVPVLLIKSTKRKSQSIGTMEPFWISRGLQHQGCEVLVQASSYSAEILAYINGLQSYGVDSRTLQNPHVDGASPRRPVPIWNFSWTPSWKSGGWKASHATSLVTALLLITKLKIHTAPKYIRWLSFWCYRVSQITPPKPRPTNATLASATLNVFFLKDFRSPNIKRFIILLRRS